MRERPIDDINIYFFNFESSSFVFNTAYLQRIRQKNQQKKKKKDSKICIKVQKILNI